MLERHLIRFFTNTYKQRQRSSIFFFLVECKTIIERKDGKGLQVEKSLLQSVFITPLVDDFSHFGPRSLPILSGEVGEQIVTFCRMNVCKQLYKHYESMQYT